MRRLLLFLLLLPLYLPAQTVQGGKGLRGVYYRGTDFNQQVLVRYDAAINFVWTHKPPGGGDDKRVYIVPAPGMSADNFSVRWTADLRAPETGTYTLSITTDDGMRVFLGEAKVLDGWRIQRERNYTAEVYLEAGKYYPLRVEYFNGILDATAILLWRPPSQPETEPMRPIPATQFYLPVVRPVSAPFRPQASDRGEEPVVAAPVQQAPPPPAEAEARPAAPSPAPAAAPAPEAAPVRRPATAARPRPPAPAVPTRLRRGETVTLPSLYFELDSPDLMPASEPTLDALVRALERDTTLHIEIAGHTDISRDPAASQLLSLSRANAIRDYLVESGISQVRIATVGYGATHPLVPRRDPTNRRVEVKVR